MRHFAIPNVTARTVFCLTFIFTCWAACIYTSRTRVNIPSSTWRVASSSSSCQTVNFSRVLSTRCLEWKCLGIGCGGAISREENTHTHISLSSISSLHCVWPCIHHHLFFFFVDSGREWAFLSVKECHVYRNAWICCGWLGEWELDWSEITRAAY